MPSSPTSAVSTATLAIDAVARGPLPVLAMSNVATTAFSGAETFSLSGMLNLIAQPLKQPVGFRQNIWLLPVLFILGVAIAFLVTWLVTDDVRQSLSQGILKGGSAAWQSAVNYYGLGPKGLGLLGAGTDAPVPTQ